MPTTTLRFRDAKVRVKDEVTIISGELLDMDKIASLVADALKADETFVDDLREAIGEANYVDFTITWLDRLSPEQMVQIMEWLNDDPE